MTNYERIKTYSLELMALTIMCPNDTGDADIKCKKNDGGNCLKCTYNWLQEEEK